MKRFSFALAALFLSSNAWAVEPAGNTALPFPNARMPESAKNADEAPRWTPGPAPAVAATPNNPVPNNTAPNNTLPNNAALSNTVPTANAAVANPLAISLGNAGADTAPANANASPNVISNPFDASANDANALAQRPLKSVMKQRQPTTAATNTVPSATAPYGTPTPAASPANLTLGGPVAEPSSTAAANAYGTYGGPTNSATTPVDNGVVQTSGNIPSAARTEVEPARYEPPLQLGLPPATESNVEATVGASTIGVTPTASAPLLFNAPADAKPLVPPTTAVENPPQNGVVQAAATQAIPDTRATNESAVDPQKVAATRAAADLLATSAISPPEPFYGPNTSTISLASTLSNVSEQNRTAAVAAYWRLCVATRGYHWAVDELKRLEQVVTRRGSFETSMLSTARAAAEARIEEAKIQVIRYQATLENLMGQNGQPGVVFDARTQTTQKRPAATYLASDSPLVGPYRTYFDVLYANRAAPSRAREVDRILPIRWEAINDRTVAVHSANSAVHFAEQAHAKGDADIRIVLACHEELQKQRRAFLNAVLDYNIDVADYAVAVATPGTTNEKLVSMLIHTKQADRVTSLPGRTALGGISSSSTFATPPANAAATSTTRESDGWVPSSLRSLDPLAPRTANPARTNSPNANTSASPVQSQPDPFRTPATGNRYGGRYGDQ